MALSVSVPCISDVASAIGLNCTLNQSLFVDKPAASRAINLNCCCTSDVSPRGAARFSTTEPSFAWSILMLSGYVSDVVSVEFFPGINW